MKTTLNLREGCKVYGSLPETVPDSRNLAPHLTVILPERPVVSMVRAFADKGPSGCICWLIETTSNGNMARPDLFADTTHDALMIVEALANGHEEDLKNILRSIEERTAKLQTFAPSGLILPAGSKVWGSIPELDTNEKFRHCWLNVVLQDHRVINVVWEPGMFEPGEFSITMQHPDPTNYRAPIRTRWRHDIRLIVESLANGKEKELEVIVQNIKDREKLLVEEKAKSNALLLPEGATIQSGSLPTSQHTDKRRETVLFIRISNHQCIWVQWCPEAMVGGCYCTSFKNDIGQDLLPVPCITVDSFRDIKMVVETLASGDKEKIALLVSGEHEHEKHRQKLSREYMAKIREDKAADVAGASPKPEEQLTMHEEAEEAEEQKPTIKGIDFKDALRDVMDESEKAIADRVFARVLQVLNKQEEQETPQKHSDKLLQFLLRRHASARPKESSPSVTLKTTEGDAATKFGVIGVKEDMTRSQLVAVHFIMDQMKNGGFGDPTDEVLERYYNKIIRLVRGDFPRKDPAPTNGPDKQEPPTRTFQEILDNPTDEEVERFRKKWYERFVGTGEPSMSHQEASPCQRLPIRNCARCHCDHDLWFYPLPNPSDSYKWYSWCPTNGGPILCRIDEETEESRAARDGIDEPIVWEGETLGFWVNQDGKMELPGTPGTKFIPLAQKRYPCQLALTTG